MGILQPFDLPQTAPQQGRQFLLGEHFTGHTSVLDYGSGHGILIWFHTGQIQPTTTHHDSPNFTHPMTTKAPRLGCQKVAKFVVFGFPSLHFSASLYLL